MKSIRVVRYNTRILDWSQSLTEWLLNKDEILLMFGAPHKKGSAARVYMNRKNVETGLIRVVGKMYEVGRACFVYDCYGE